MTDKEILAELTKCYEYLHDIRENGCIDHCCGQLGGKLVDYLEIAKNNVENLYYDFYRKLDKEELRVPILEKQLNCKVYIARCVGGGYETIDENNEQTSITCEDVDFCWYEDCDFLIKNLEEEM